jgi:hypothetical protein
MRDGLLATKHVRAIQEELAGSSIQEELAGFLLEEIIAPTGEYHRQYNFGQS